MPETLRLEEVARDDRSVLTVGTFDGVHLGHQAILGYLHDRAVGQEGRSVVVTFDPHPREVVHNEAVPLLTTPAERSALIEALGIDRIVVVPFTKDFARLTSEEFVRDVLVGKIGLKEIVIGYDHGFGRDRKGNRETLEKLGSEWNFTVDVIPAQEVHETVVSSTQIRKALTEEGDVHEAAEMLGRAYALSGSVTGGNARGRSIGFPTANVVPEHPRKVVPRIGVYAVLVSVPGQEVQRVPGMLNIGYRPTFENGTRQTIEVHLIDYDGDLYDRELTIEFVRRIRDERKFRSVEELQDQLRRDRLDCMRVLSTVT